MLILLIGKCLKNAIIIVTEIVIIIVNILNWRYA